MGFVKYVEQIGMMKLISFKKENIMATQSKEQVEKMTDKQQEEYCKWCWYHDYGNCDNCAIHKGMN